MSDDGRDPRWLGQERADNEAEVRELAEQAEVIQVFLRLTTSPDWRSFMVLVERKAEEVSRALTHAADWDVACRLQGRRQTYDWLLGFEEQQQVAMAAVLEALQGYQERLEEST